MSVPRAPQAWMSNGATAEPSPIDSSSTALRSPQRTPRQAGRDHLLQRAVDPRIVEDVSQPHYPEHYVRPVSRVSECEQDHGHSPARDPASEAACHPPAPDQYDGKRTAEEASHAELADAGRP